MQWTRELWLPPTSRSSSRIAPMATEEDPDALLPDSLFEFVSNIPTNLLLQSAPSHSNMCHAMFIYLACDYFAGRSPDSVKGGGGVNAECVAHYDFLCGLEESQFYAIYCVFPWPLWYVRWHCGIIRIY